MNVPNIWSPGDAASLNDFLKTPLGVRWIAALMTMKPKVDIKSGMEAAALGGAYVAGYEHLLHEVIPATRATITQDATALKPLDMTRD